MSSSPAPHLPTQQTALVNSAPSWLLIPTWMGSIVFHVFLAVLIVILSQLPSCRAKVKGESGEPFRSVGIRQIAGGGDSGNQGGENSGSEVASDSSNRQNSIAEITPQPDLSLTPPVPLSLPDVSQPRAVIGTGPSIGSQDVLMNSLVRPSLPGNGSVSGGRGGGQSGTGGPDKGIGTGGGTRFHGIEAVGKKFVYVIDRSFSMAEQRALDAAKLELLASLQLLTSDQYFQVIFYNNEHVVLNTRRGKYDVFRGTDPQRLLVSDQLREVTPAGGTNHLPAILEALKFNPDVVYVLTDGTTDNALSAADLAQIRKENRSKASIHCIQFGRGAEPKLVGSANFLRTLSEQNSGKYVYRDLKAGF
ncbi:vWA domain-containing protein [Planctomicrobium sp. SH668]|uniref:vWA domain-containing protein n=1 Tax=Planctomicrobium sp. SH668 TaxID=3448126 RepID=UPI003F5CB406